MQGKGPARHSPAGSSGGTTSVRPSQSSILTQLNEIILEHYVYSRCYYSVGMWCMCAMPGAHEICRTAWEVNAVLRMGHLKMRAMKVKSLHVTMLMCARSMRRPHVSIQQPRVLCGRVVLWAGVALKNVGRVEVDSHVLVVLQVASTSRASSGASLSRGGPMVGNCAATPTPLPRTAPTISTSRGQGRHGPAQGAPQVLALREGEELPEGYKYVVRDPATPTAVRKSTETVDLTTPRDAGMHRSREVLHTSARSAAERRNVNRSTNKQVHAAYAKEIKDSLAGGRPPVMNVSENQTHLKSRWHATAKEIAYKILDMRKEKWKDYDAVDKAKVHKELNAQMKFDQPLDPQRVDKYLAGHLRSARAVWKRMRLVCERRAESGERR